MAKKKAPSRTSMRGAQGQTKSRMSGRTKTARQTNRGQKQQSQAQSEKEAPRTARGGKSTKARSTTTRTRAGKQSRQAQQSQSPSRTRASEGTRTRGTTTGRPRKQNRPQRADRDEDRTQRQQTQKTHRQRWDEDDARMMQMSASERAAEREPRSKTQMRGQRDDIERKDETRQRQQAAARDDGRQFGAGERSPPQEDRDRDVEDLDYARRHTSISNEGGDEGYGRSEGPASRRLSQMSQYGADDDEHQYGRNLGARNRIPGAGSRRNR